MDKRRKRQSGTRWAHEHRYIISLNLCHDTADFYQLRGVLGLSVSRKSKDFPKSCLLPGHYYLLSECVMVLRLLQPGLQVLDDGLL